MMKRRLFNLQNTRHQRTHVSDDAVHEKMQQGIDNWVKALRTIKESPERRNEDVISRNLTSDQS
jgi:hypothetical protein